MTTVVEPDRPRHVMVDGPTTLTLMAAATERVQIGTLVSSLYFRQPLTLAKAAMTVDQLTRGRIEVALGVGDPSAGQAAAGITWSPAERVARFGEFVELVDLLLRQRVTDFYRVTAERCARFDELVVGLGRHPQRIRHSLVCFPPLTPWESSDYFTDMVGRFRSFGVDEFVLYWPGCWRPDAAHEHRVFEQVTTETIPALRAEQTRDVSRPGA